MAARGSLDVSASADGGLVYEPGWLAADDSHVAPTSTNLACDSYATWTDRSGKNERLPIDCVNWYEAYAFCIWDDGFLPSEAEWEFAAANGDEMREYPWGSGYVGLPGGNGTLSVSYCSYASPGSPAGCNGDVTNIAPVGTAVLGAGAWGQLDLAGNVRQWNLDWSAPYVTCGDCANLSGGRSRALRGDVAWQGASETSARTSADPALRAGGTGFRCARSP